MNSEADPAQASPRDTTSSAEEEARLHANERELPLKKPRSGELYIWVLLSIVPILSMFPYILIGYISFERIVSAFFTSTIILTIPSFSRKIFGAYPFAAIVLAARDVRKTPPFLSSDILIQKSRGIVVAPDNVGVTERSVRIDPRKLLEEFARDSTRVANQIYTRAGVYLMAGAFIALLGIGIFYFRTVSIERNDSTLNHLLDLIPGFGVLFFVEFVAIFFLRQYRAAMDDFRYYDAVRRHREESLIILYMFSENPTSTATADVLKAMSIYSTAGRLGKDETTEMLETRKLQRDELILFEKMVEALNSFRERRSTTQEASASGGSTGR
ncbi:hypothetical protein [Roseomonas sp. BN140053]|uniref:hypothetical protein n=1 Tax=Roseomonas sp. BN140053 TaxID=3391898 RepID=UPI0039E77F30